MSATPAHPELGFYTLAGAPKSPRDMLGELAHAEELGLGTAFISERFNIKEAGADGLLAVDEEGVRHIDGNLFRATYSESNRSTFDRNRG
jgi:hypothetical protein